MKSKDFKRANNTTHKDFLTDKWCPMSRLEDSDSKSTYNRGSMGELIEESSCYGSDCMMWRYYFPSGKLTKEETEDYTFNDGYCGLAGKV